MYYYKIGKCRNRLYKFFSIGSILELLGYGGSFKEEASKISYGLWSSGPLHSRSISRRRLEVQLFCKVISEFLIKFSQAVVISRLIFLRKFLQAFQIASYSILRMKFMFDPISLMIEPVNQGRKELLGTLFENEMEKNSSNLK